MEADKYGHCIKCHKNMLYDQIIGGKSIPRFSADYTEVEYLLDDMSKMRVAICSACKNSLTEKDNDTVMKSVIEGWKQEVANLDWEESKKKAYLEKYSQKNIVCKSEGVEEDALKEKHKVYTEAKSEVKKWE